MTQIGVPARPIRVNARGFVVPAMLTPGEGVVSVRGMDAIGPDGLRQINNGEAPRGAGVIRNSFVINNPVLDNEARVDELAEAIAKRIRRGGGLKTSWERAMRGAA